MLYVALVFCFYGGVRMYPHMACVRIMCCMQFELGTRWTPQNVRFGFCHIGMWNVVVFELSNSEYYQVRSHSQAAVATRSMLNDLRCIKRCHTKYLLTCHKSHTQWFNELAEACLQLLCSHKVTKEEIVQVRDLKLGGITM